MGLAMSYLRVPPVLEGERDPGAIARLIFGTADWRRRQPGPQVLDLGGGWQALHYLITGDPWDGRPPEADVVCGGRLLTEDGTAELGLDVIYLAPDRVKPAADHLVSTPYAKIAERYDPAAMAAAGVQEAEALGPDAGTLRPAYEGLTRFFQAAANDGQAVYKVMSESS
ncbi:YfbM family protein [Spirillospora sp. CA-255316]